MIKVTPLQIEGVEVVDSFYIQVKNERKEPGYLGEDEFSLVLLDERFLEIDLWLFYTYVYDMKQKCGAEVRQPFRCLTAQTLCLRGSI